MKRRGIIVWMFFVAVFALVVATRTKADDCSTTAMNCVVAPDGTKLVDSKTDDDDRYVLINSPEGQNESVGNVSGGGIERVINLTGATALGAVYGTTTATNNGVTSTAENRGGFYQWPPGTTNYYPIQIGIKGGGAGGDKKILCASCHPERSEGAL